MRFILILLPALLALAGCGGSNDAGSGGVTASEAEQLNQAAAATDLSANNTQEHQP